MLNTAVTRLFGLEHPLLGAPMALHSGGRLAAAVSRAGGLGLFGGIHPGGGDWVRQQIGIVRSETDRPFGVGFITQFLPRFEANLKACLDEGVPVLAFSFGDPRPYAARAKENGARVICQVQTVEGARRRLDYRVAPVLMGQSAGLVKEIKPAAEVIRRISEDAERFLRVRAVGPRPS